MEQQITIDNPTQAKLSDEDQRELVNFITRQFKLGKQEREKYEEDWKRCDKAYQCEMEPIATPELEWQSNLCLPWAYDAGKSWHAYMHQTMMPKDDDIFTIDGRTLEDDPGAEVMQTDIEHVLDISDFPSTFGKALMQAARKNHACGKVYWKKNVSIEYEWVLDELTGMHRRQAREIVDYNNPWMDIIDLDNFVFYPIHGDFNKTTRIHETYRFYDELKAAVENGEAPYFNIDQLSDDDEKEAPDPSSSKYWESGEEFSGKKKHAGLNLKEAWIHRVKIGGKVYRNYIATIVNDKTLIRFQPNNYPMGKSPFVWLALEPDGDCLYGYGLLSKGMPILSAANLTFNQKLNEIKIKMHPPHKFYDDGVFNPYNVINRPGAMIETSQQGTQDNVIPLLQDLSHIQLAYSEVAELKAEFESVTVPKVVKGMIEAGDRTATEIQGVMNNASGKQHVEAFHINQSFLKPVIELFYLLKYQRIVTYQDQEVLLQTARLTQEAVDENGQELPPEALLQKMPRFLPLPEVDIKVVGYQNVIRKQESLGAIGQVVPQLTATPAAKYILWPKLAEEVFRLSDLPTDRLLADKEQQAEIDQNEQQQSKEQQDLLILQEKTKLDIEMFKEQSRAEIDKMKLQLQAETDSEKLRLEELKIMFQYGQQAEQMERDNAELKSNDGKPESPDNRDTRSDR